MKSYLTGNPPIAIALNDGLVIGRREGGGADFGYGRASDLVQLDDCNFHEARARWGWRRALRGPPAPCWSPGRRRTGLWAGGRVSRHVRAAAHCCRGQLAGPAPAPVDCVSGVLGSPPLRAPGRRLC